jgi:1-acyl-sn-glycerol-3-phosphate acyltransferase
MEGLIQRYVRRVVVADPVGLARVRGRGAIFVGNHQVQIESLIITNLLAGLFDTPVVTMANAKHEERWIGWLLRTLFSYPGCIDPDLIVYFDQKRPDSMFKILENMKPDLAAGRRSFFVHPEGTRSQSCRDPVMKISSLFLDMALELNLPVVPVRFSGGLPVEPISGKLDFPFDHGSQDYIIGAPILPDELRGLAYGERGPRVVAAMNALGPAAQQERPNTTDPAFAGLVHEWQEQTGTSEVEATLFRILQELEHVGPEAASLIEGARRGVLNVGSDPKSLWLAELARHLYGPKGPRVEVDSV